MNRFIGWLAETISSLAGQFSRPTYDPRIRTKRAGRKQDGLSWWLVEQVSRLLEPDERDAVRGDLQESGESGEQTLLELTGLVVWRYAAPWMNWQPWAAPLGLVAPLLLVFGSRRIGEPWLAEVGLQVETLWHYKTRYQVGLPVFDDFFKFICICALMVMWGLTGGFAFGAMARKLAWIHPVLISFTVWFFGFPVVAMLRESPHQPRVGDLILWLIAPTLLFAMPLFLGVYFGSRSIAVNTRRIVLMAAGLAVLTLVIQMENSRAHIDYDVWARGESTDARWVWKPEFFPFAAILWQLGITGAIARWQRRQTQIKAIDEHA